ncbi:MAG: endonuclease [Phycisphaerales bacterium JB065]
MHHSARGCQITAGVGVFLLAAGLAIGSDSYGPPANYYDSVVYDGSADTLRATLNAIIDGHTVRSYGDARQALAILDQDPNNPNNIILMYSGVSISGNWDSGATWNREHMWPRSRGVGDSGADNSDLHHLRPSNPSINSSRGNKPFGLASSSYWDPTMNNSPYDFRGEAARCIFYMDVRYDGADSSTANLRVVNGFPSSEEMGDLTYLLDWHYDEAPSSRERRRNHLVYSFDDNPFYAQGNRNPFVDHPEFAWALWGDEPNNSQIVLEGGTVEGDGVSTLDLDLGRFILSPTLEDAFAQTVTIQKSGSTPTSYIVEASGDAYSEAHGIPGTFSRGNRDASFDVVLWSPLPGELSGQILVTNTDLTSAGNGLGDADGEDLVTLTGVGLNPSIASVAPTAGLNSFIVDFGSIERSVDADSELVPLFNAGGAADTTAGLIVTGVDANGDASTIAISGIPAEPIAGSSVAIIDLSLDRGGPLGTYEVVYSIQTADEAIPGAMPGQTLTLTVTAELVASSCPADTNGDGSIDLADLNAVLAGFGQAEGATLADGDASGDGAVALDDLNIILASFGTACP